MRNGGMATLCMAGAILALGGCGDDAPPVAEANNQADSGSTPVTPDNAAPETKTVTITRTTPEDGTSVILSRGADLIVALQANQTTPYEWRAAEIPAQLRLLGDSYVGDHYGGPDDPQPVGAGGTQKLRFRAEQPGRARLLLRHVSHDGRHVAQTVPIDVTVQ